MGLFNKFFGAKEENAQQDTPAMESEKNTIYSPLSGTAIPLKEIGDGVFSEGVLGQGCGIRPAAETVFAPFNGKIIQVADTKHAIGIESQDGIELLIHVGIDTVEMQGNGFTVHVKCGDTVKCGQKLLSFSKSAIANAGYSDTTAVLVTNSDDFQEVQVFKTGTISKLDKLICIQ